MVVTDFWAAQTVPKSFQAGVASWRTAIAESQQSATACDSVCRCAPHHAGLASKLHASAVCLLQATLNRCAIVGPPTQLNEYTTNSTLRERCTGFECYFQPISRCSQQAGASRSSVKTIHADQRHLLQPFARVANMTGLRSELLIMSTLVAWVMRPQPILVDAAHHFAVLAGIAADEAPRCVSQHVRHGDKVNALRSNAALFERLSSTSFWRWGVRLATVHGGERVLFMTDASSVQEDLTSFESPVPFVPVPAPLECFVAAGHVKGAATDVLKRRRGKGLSSSPACNPTFTDEGLQMISGIVLLSQCMLFVGQQTSNVDRVVVELLATRQYPPASYDVLNDVYAPAAMGVGLHELTTWRGAMTSVKNTRNDPRVEDSEPVRVARPVVAHGSGDGAGGLLPSSALAAAWQPATQGAPAPPRLRIAWLGVKNETVSSVCSSAEDVQYYCEWYRALRDSPEVDLSVTDLLNPDDTPRTGPLSADAILLPHHCTVNVPRLPVCFVKVRSDDPPLVVMLNKMFEGVRAKMSTLHRHRQQVALIVAATPTLRQYEQSSGVRAAFLPYGVSPRFGIHANASMEYTHDLGFTGGWQRFNPRYPMRGQAFSRNNTNRMRERGVRIFAPNHMLKAEEYIRAIATSKLWFATSEVGEHASTRFYEVLFSGRCMLVCNRDLAAYAPLGFVEGKHMAMFGSPQEFEAKVYYYLSHEEERMTMVRNAREFVLSHHMWKHRAAEFVASVRLALANRSLANQRRLRRR